MPGLVGVIGKGPSDQRRQELSRMLGCMYKKDSFESGMYIDEELHVYAGWTCHKGSYSDCLPIISLAGDIVMLFGGEHYSLDGGEEERLAREYRCLRDKASVLIHLYSDKGEACLSSLNGFYHGLIIDRRDKKVILFNDRFGMQRLYYYEEPDAFFFASEAKSILEIRHELRSFDQKSLGEWLSCGAVLENRCLFKGIQLLPGAALWMWRPDLSISRRRYFMFESWERQHKLNSEEFYSRLHLTFSKILPSYLRSNRKIGLSTTGGLDTRMILANLRTEKDLIHCYSFCGPYRECLDVSIGRRVAHVAGFPHSTITIDADFFRQFNKLAENVVLSTDGNLELSGAPNLFVNEIAHEIAPVRLTGNYGSEVLRRHRAFSPSNVVNNVLQDDYAASVKNAGKTWAGAKECNGLTFVAFKQAPWYSYNRLQAEQSIMNMRSPFMDNAFLEIVFQAPEAATASNAISLRLIADGNPRLGEIMTDRGVSYPRKPSWPLMRAYYEFIFKMEYYASHGMPRFAASVDQRLGALSIERNFLGRNKYYHLRQWFRDELKQLVKDIMLDNKTLGREFLKPQEVVRAVKAHLDGKENNTFIIDKLITLEFISRLLFKAT